MITTGWYAGLSEEVKEKRRQVRREWYQRNKDKELSRNKAYRQATRQDRQAARRRWDSANRDERRLKQREAEHAIRKEVLIAYGGVCVCCRETNLRLLTLDHKFDDGAEHRRVFGQKTMTFMRYLRREGYPQNLGLRVMCYNCNCGRAANGGICPHEEA